MPKSLFIVNPAASGGVASERWRSLQATAGVSEGDCVESTRPGHATDLARTAAGYEVLVAVGGDGTVREVANGVLQRAAPRPTLAILPLGTGNDLARALGLDSLEVALTALTEGHVRAVDAIQVECRHHGKPAVTHGLLTTSAGVGAEVVTCLRPWMKRWLGAQPAYLLSTLLAILKYRTPEMRLRWQSGSCVARLLIANVGNAEYESGGSMQMSPGARIDDGLANICLIRSNPKLRILRKLPTIIDGSHLHEPEVSYFTADWIEIESTPPARLQMDGDAFGTTPARFTVLPGAVRFLAPRWGC